MQRIDLGEIGDSEAVCQLMDVAGLRLMDVGCGPALTSRELVARGAEVVGVEPDPVQAARNRVADPVEGLILMEGRAEALPTADQTIDGVMFFRSLHHVPVPAMDAALTEAARVLKPGGWLAIVEPGITGSHFAVMRPFHDETHVRNEAQAALARTARSQFGSAEYFGYMQHPRYASFEAMVARITGQTFNSISRDQVETDEVRDLFGKGATPEGDFAFEQPMLLDIYRMPIR